MFTFNVILFLVVDVYFYDQNLLFHNQFLISCNLCGNYYTNTFQENSEKFPTLWISK